MAYLNIWLMAASGVFGFGVGALWMCTRCADKAHRTEALAYKRGELAAWTESTRQLRRAL